MKPDLSIGITTSYSLNLGVHCSETIKQYGLKSVWIGDDIGGPRDIYAYTSTVLSVSPQVEAGIGIVSPFYHNLSTIARSSATIAELHGNRFRLGLGVGGLHLLKERGIIPSRPVEGIKVAVETLRKIFQGEKVSLKTYHYYLNDYKIWNKIPIPIYLGVRGPKLLKLASEIADGVILSAPKPYIKEFSKLFTIAKSNRGLKVVGWLPTILVRNEDENILKYIVQVVGTVAADTPNKVLEISDIDVEKVEQIRQEVSRRRWDRVSDLIDDDFAENFIIYGSHEKLCDNLISWADKSGIDEIIFGPPYGKDPTTAISEMVSTWVNL